jgi:hypothetical protein
VWKLGEILQGIEQSKIFRDFFDSERFKASQKRTKQARVKTRGRFHTALYGDVRVKLYCMSLFSYGRGVF